MLTFDHVLVEKIRREKGIMISKLAKELGIHRITYWKWERGVILPKEENVRLIAHYLGISVTKISNLNEVIPKSDYSINKQKKLLDLLTEKSLFSEYKNRISSAFSLINDLNDTLENVQLLISSIINSMSSIIYIKDNSLKYSIVNKSFREYLYLSETSIVGKSDFDFFSKKDAEINSSEDKTVFQKGESFFTERHIPGTRGQKWGIIAKTPIFDSHKKIVGVVGCFIDTTKKKEIEKIKDLLDINSQAMLIGVLIYSEDDLNILYANKAVEKIFGYQVQNFYKKGISLWLSLIHPEDLSCTNDSINNIELNSVQEYKIITATGDTKWIEARTNSIVFMDKKCISIFIADITDRKKADEIKELLEINIEASSTIAISVYDYKEDKFIYMNSANQKVYGYPNEKFFTYGYNFWFQIIHPDDKETEMKYLENRNHPKVKTVKIIDSEGKIRWIRSHVSKSHYKGRECFIFADQDITNEVKEHQYNEILLEHMSKTNDCLCIANYKDKEIIYLSSGWSKITGYTLEEMNKNGSPIEFWENKILHPEYRNQVEDAERFKGDHIVWEYKFITKDGKERWIEEHISSNNKIIKEKVCYVVTANDITEKKEKEELRKLMEAAMNACSFGIFIGLPTSKKPIYINQSFGRIYGCSIDEFYEKGFDLFLSFIHPDDRVKQLKYAKNGKWPSEQFIRIIRRDGEHRKIKRTISPTIINNIQYDLSITQDVT